MNTFSASRRERHTPVITCAICKRPVERVYVETRAFSGDTHIRVECHGEVDNAVISDVDRMLMGRELDAQPQEAFRVPRLQDAVTVNSVTSQR